MLDFAEWQLSKTRVHSGTMTHFSLGTYNWWQAEKNKLLQI